MKVLVTGSSGFIGSELVKQLSSLHEIVLFDLVEGQDIRKYDQVRKAMQGCDMVVHLAAHKKPYEDKTFQDYFETNCIGTFNVAQAAISCGVKRFIYASSTSYYGIEKGIPFVQPIKEDNPIATQHVKADELSCRDCDIAYSNSKVIAEQILANYGLTKKMQVIILRLGPTRKKGEYRPFGDIQLHLKIENALQAFEQAINTSPDIWYEAFTISDENPQVDIGKARNILGYKPI